MPQHETTQLDMHGVMHLQVARNNVLEMDAF
jgi:hypothetical protein